MKQKRICAASLALTLILTLFTGCQTNDVPGPSATQTEQGSSAESPQDEVTESVNVKEYKPVPNKLFATSQGAWVGDVMPLADGEELKLYYLYDTDHNGPTYHPIHLLSTTNLYDYRDDGLAVPCGPDTSARDAAIGTGTVMIDQEGLYHCFYTGHNDRYQELGIDRSSVMHAVSTDGINFEKLPEDTFYAPEGYSTDDFRDPFVFWNEEKGCYWLLIAAHSDELGGVVTRYSSDDLHSWTMMDPLYAPNAQYMLECPDLFKHGDTYYLVYSWDCVTYYATADSIDGPFRQADDPVLASDGFSFYAAKTAEVGGTRYLCGWIGRKNEPKDAGNYDWAGTMMVHELVFREDGTLGIREPHTYSGYFTQEKALSVQSTTGTVEQAENSFTLLSQGKEDISVVNLGQREPVFQLDCTVRLTEDGYAGFCFGESDKNESLLGLVIDGHNDCLHYEGTILSRMPYVDPLIKTDYPIEPGVDYQIRMVMENEIVTVYIDNAKVLCARVYKAMNGGSFGLFASNTGAEFRDVTLRVPE